MVPALRVTDWGADDPSPVRMGPDCLAVDDSTVVICPPDGALCKVTDQPSSSPIHSGIDKSTWGIGLGVLALIGALGVHGFISASRDAARLAAEAGRTLKEEFDDLGKGH